MLDCFVVRRKTHRAAMVNAACCDGQHNVLRLATQRAAFGNAPSHIVKEKVLFLLSFAA